MVQDFAAANFQIGQQIVLGIEAMVGARAAHQVMRVAGIPRYGFDPHIGVPGIAQFQSAEFGQITRGDLA